MPQSRRLFVRWKYFCVWGDLHPHPEWDSLPLLVGPTKWTNNSSWIISTLHKFAMKFIGMPWIFIEKIKKISLEMNMKTDAWCCIESRGIFRNFPRINRFRDRNIHCQRVQNRAKPMAHHYSNNSVVLIFGVSKSQFPTGRNIKLPTNDPRERKITSATVWHEVITTFRVNSN